MEIRKCFDYNLKSKYENDFFIIEVRENKLINYHLEMITNNKLKTILPCNIYFKNNLPSFYYKIESFNTFRNIMMSENFNSIILEKLLLDLNNLTNELDSFLLNRKYVLLDLDLIFYSDITESFSFIYLPIQTEKQNNDVLEEFILKIYYILANMYPDLLNEIKSILSNSIYNSLIESINKVDTEFEIQLNENTLSEQDLMFNFETGLVSNIMLDIDSKLEFESKLKNQNKLAKNLKFIDDSNLSNDLDLHSDFNLESYSNNLEDNFVSDSDLGFDSDSKSYPNDIITHNKSAEKLKSVFKHSSFNKKNASPITINMDTEVLGVTLKNIFILLASQITLLLLYLFFTVLLNNVLTSNSLIEFPNYILIFAECLLLISTFFYIKRIKANQNIKYYNNNNKDNKIIKDSNRVVGFSNLSDINTYTSDTNLNNTASLSIDDAIETSYIENVYNNIIVNDCLDNNCLDNNCLDDDCMDDDCLNDDCLNDDCLNDDCLVGNCFVDGCTVEDISNSKNIECFESCKCEMNAYAVLFKKNDNSIIKFPINKENYVISSISKITDLFILPKNNELILTSIFVKYGSCFIEDTHSTAGTYLNGCLLTAGISHKLNDEDDIIISDEHFTFQYHKT